eukprot:183329_1
MSVEMILSIFLLLPAVLTGTTMHDNYVFFKCENIANYKFYMDDYSISSGQPWDGITYSTQTDYGSIDAKAGRHGTSEVANWFKIKLGGGQAVGIDSGDTTSPDDLNFAFYGDMSFDLENKSYALPNVAIGQGHFTTRNNWWFGGPGWQKTDNSLFEASVTYKNISIHGPYAVVVGYTYETNGYQFGLAVQSAY